MGLEKIKQLSKIKNVSLDELSDISGVPKSTINKIINGITENPGYKTILSLAHALSLSADEFIDLLDLGLEEPKFSSSDKELISKYKSLDSFGRRVINSVLDIELDRYNQFKQQQADQQKAELQYTKEESEEQPELYARRIRRGGVANNAPPIPKKEHKMTKLNHFEGAYGAGGGQINDNTTMITIEVSEDEVPEGADTTINIAGDSMEPTLSDGDVVYVQHTNQLEIGDIGVFYLDGRNFIKEYGGDELISHNSEYAPIQIHEFSTFVIQGKVLGKKIEGFVEL